jgi:predicted P-loop ATPase
VPLSGDTPASVQFFRDLEPDGPWLLVAINPDPGAARKAELAEFSPTEENALAAWIDARQGSWNIYYTSNLPASAPFVTSKKDAVTHLRVLHVDVDLPGAADDEAASSSILEDLRSLDPPPSAIVFTGGGYQALWRLSSRLDAPDFTARIEAANTAIWKLLGGDHCHDVSRLLRLPGTINVPNPKKAARGRVPALAHLVEADWTRCWSLAADSLPRFPEGRQQLPTRDQDDSSSGILAQLPTRLQKLIRSGDSTSFGNDRSRLGWFVMCDLVRRGWTDDDVARLFLDPALGISAHFLDQSSSKAYVARNTAKARESVARDWNRDRVGAILPRDQENVDRALAGLGVKLSYDQLADRVWVNGAGPAIRLSDEEVDRLWLKVQAEYDFLPEPRFFRTVFTVRARERSFHPVLDYLRRVQPTWDGTRRIGSEPEQTPDDPVESPSWLTTYGGVEDTPYTRAVGRLTLVAAVRRMRHPGCKFDEMLMLVDPTQGTNKSMAVRTLAVEEDWFNDYLPIGEAGREVIEHIRGYWIIEAQELAGMSTREVERVKSFCSRQNDRGRMSYDRLTTDLPRACVFIGTTNEDAIFTDLLNRRYWPVTILREFDIGRLREDLDQLWAEACQAEISGESIRLARSLWPVAAEVQAKYRLEESWATLLDLELGHISGRITSVDLYKIINKNSGQVLSTDNRRLGRAMREIGFERRQVRDNLTPNPRWYYMRGKTQAEQGLDILVVRDPVAGSLQITNEIDESGIPRPIQTYDSNDVPF